MSEPDSATMDRIVAEVMAAAEVADQAYRRRVQKTKNVVAILAVVAAVFIIGGIVAGSTVIHSNGVSCGSAFMPDKTESQIFDATLSSVAAPTDYATSCGDARQQRFVFALFGIGLGVIVGLGAAVIAAQRQPMSNATSP